MKLIDPMTRIALKNILFATDFSPISKAALPFAESIARRYGAKLIAAHVISPTETRMVPPESWGACQQALDDAADELMNELAAQIDAETLPHDVVIRHGLVSDAISELIEENSADLVVMGTRGRSGLGRLVLGSAAEAIFRQAPCPVLSIGPRVLPQLQPQREPDFKRIVFATDFNPESRAADYAFSLAQEYQAQLTLVHVAPPAAGQAIDAERVIEARTSDLRNLVPLDAELWCRPECTVRFGTPADAILAVAAEKQADLIVLGVRSAAGHLGVATHAAAATAHSVVSCAPCPVLTVR